MRHKNTVRQLGQWIDNLCSPSLETGAPSTTRLDGGRPDRSSRPETGDLHDRRGTTYDDTRIQFFSQKVPWSVVMFQCFIVGNALWMLKRQSGEGYAGESLGVTRGREVNGSFARSRNNQPRGTCSYIHA